MQNDVRNGAGHTRVSPPRNLIRFLSGYYQVIITFQSLSAKRLQFRDEIKIAEHENRRKLQRTGKNSFTSVGRKRFLLVRTE